MLQTEASLTATTIDALLAEFSDDPTLRERAEDLVRALVEFYDIGLRRLVGTIGDRPDGHELMTEVAADKLVTALLVLHDLHPASTEERVAAALVRVRPYLGSHAGDVELVGVDDDNVVRLRLTGSCDGCPSSAVTVKLAIERAIEEAAPEVVRVEVDGVVAPAPRGPGGRTLLPVLGAPTASAAAVPTAAATSEPIAGTWMSLETAADVAPGQLAARRVGSAPTVVANIGGVLYAFGDHCPKCAGALSGGVLDGVMLRCGGCGHCFDLSRAGAGDGYRLDPLPLLAEDGDVRVGVPAVAAR